ncbi:hypothetical protein CEUSTIGMA_g3847.t1 [Chlamydomonas eustigma]|uniref:RAP domain-containing protein n=1 Tax=Chlamydomonas eustigma TaxID=1157962 RepID=A0A250X0I2_9CHLO|nr:hypothetical protein CEUSTIGMA_g3847.t1 [Chlamydomonas eustigma]|eukprot:GAX76402.1 hypothetical protein CEUSTIGMA_g3847.t1 [Chlamydomonas eustigma]
MKLKVGCVSNGETSCGACFQPLKGLHVQHIVGNLKVRVHGASYENKFYFITNESPQSSGYSRLHAASQPATPTHQSSTTSSAHQQDLLMSQYLKSCTTWQELRDAFMQHHPQLNHIHMTALISNLAKTAPNASTSKDERREYSQLMQDALLLAATYHAALLGPREGSTLIWAAAKAGLTLPAPKPQKLSLGVSASSGWLRPLLQKINVLAPRMKPQDISMALWALATLSEVNSQNPVYNRVRTISTDWQRETIGLDPSLSVKSISNLKSSSSYALKQQQALISQPFQPHQSISNAAARSSSSLIPTSLVPSLLQRAANNMSHFSAQALSNTLWSLAKLGVRPADTWLNMALKRMEVVMGDATPQGLANAAWALVILEHSTEGQSRWRHKFLKYSGEALEFATPAVMAQLAWASTRLKVRPEKVWLSTLASRAAALDPLQTRILLTACDAAAATVPSETVIGGDNTWDSAGRKRTGYAYNDRTMRSSGPRTPSWRSGYQHHCSPQDVSNMLWSLASHTDTYRPPAKTMQAMIAVCMEVLHAFTPHELCSVIWSLAKLGFAPSPQIMRGLLSHTSTLFPACSAQGLVNVLWAVAKLRVVQDPRWIRELLSTICLKLDEAGPQEIANLWWSLGTMRWQLGRRMREELAGEVRVRLQDFNTGETAMILWALARLGLQPHREAMLRHVQLICSRARSASPFNEGGGGNASGRMGARSRGPSLDEEIMEESDKEAGSLGSVSGGGYQDHEAEVLSGRSAATVLWAVAEMKNGELLMMMEDGDEEEDVLHNGAEVETILGMSLRGSRDVRNRCSGVMREDQRGQMRGARSRRYDKGKARIDGVLQNQLRCMLNLCLTRADATDRRACLPPEKTSTRVDSTSVLASEEGEDHADCLHQEHTTQGGGGDMHVSAFSSGSSRPMLHKWSHKEVAMALYSCKKLGMLPPSQWLLAAVHQLTAHQHPDLRESSRSSSQHEFEVNMSFRDAATAAHGLAGIIKLAPPSTGGSSSSSMALHRRASWQIAPSPLPTNHTGINPPVLPSSTITLQCAVRLLHCAAATAYSANSRELAMLFSALPVLFTSSSPFSDTEVDGLTEPFPTVSSRGNVAKPSGTSMSKPSGASMEGFGLHATKKNRDIKSITFAESTQPVCGVGVFPAAYVSEVVAVPLAAAKLGLQLDLAFCQSVIAVFLNAGSNIMNGSSCTGRGLLLPLEEQQQLRHASNLIPGSHPSARDWVSALWALERIQPHSRALLESPQGLTWLSTACKAILQLLSRRRSTAATAAATAAAAGVRSLPTWAPKSGWLLSSKCRSRLIASDKELRQAAASASALGRHAARMAALSCSSRYAHATRTAAACPATSKKPTSNGPASSLSDTQVEIVSAGQQGKDPAVYHPSGEGLSGSHGLLQAGIIANTTSPASADELKSLSRLLMLTSGRMKQVYLWQVKGKRSRLRILNNQLCNKHLLASGSH